MGSSKLKNWHQIWGVGSNQEVTNPEILNVPEPRQQNLFYGLYKDAILRKSIELKVHPNT